MGKKSRLKKEKRVAMEFAGSPTWTGDGDIQTIMKGDRPSPEKLEEMEKAYQNKIRQSPMWDEMVKKYGKAEAEKLLLQCKVKID